MVSLLRPPVFAWLDSQCYPGFRMVIHSEALGSRMDGLLKDPGVCMVGLNGAPRFLYGFILRGPSVLV